MTTETFKYLTIQLINEETIMADNNTTSIPEFKIVRRPVIFYEVSVIRGADGERRMFTNPISMNGTCGGCAPINSGEKIIACVPPAPGTTNVFVEHTTNDGEDLFTHIGVEVPGMAHSDWNDVATKWVIAAEPIEGWSDMSEDERREYLRARA